jgi:hypothetical protein
VGKVAHLWNPRGNQKLRRHWVSLGERILIGGERREQAGMLSLQPQREGELRARLRVMGREYEEVVHAGNDIVVWINGLTLFIGVKAVDEDRMLVSFGIPAGSKVNVTLDAEPGFGDDASDFPETGDDAEGDDAECPIGLCQTSL